MHLEDVEVVYADVGKDLKRKIFFEKTFFFSLRRPRQGEGQACPRCHRHPEEKPDHVKIDFKVRHCVVGVYVLFQIPTGPGREFAVIAMKLTNLNTFTFST